MNKTDIERLKKIVRLWEALDTEVKSRGLTKEQLLDDQFAQWAVTTPIYNIGEQFNCQRTAIMSIVMKIL